MNNNQVKSPEMIQAEVFKNINSEKQLLNTLEKVASILRNEKISDSSKVMMALTESSATLDLLRNKKSFEKYGSILVSLDDELELDD